MAPTDDEYTPTHFQFDTSENEPTYIIVETVAELEGVDSDELPSLYDTIDHMADNLYSDPPTAKAQVEMTFTYAGYRITLNQDGSAEFLKIPSTRK
ncbi:HalOD1 output domain-containing protein [Halorientalis salina]|uniref:HalOD1 output domain-containing protein n=1 Tax=Halorientalis salina TaxID=2932266 RepID=UPI0010ACE5BC|nr:HalOD1 output domain-containing protein [Halorientalis salina]